MDKILTLIDDAVNFRKGDLYEGHMEILKGAKDV
jgi:hypothetical protein